MPDLINSKEPDKIMLGDKQIVRKLMGDKVFYQWYVPAGTVLAKDIDSYSVTLSVPLYEVKNGITINLPERDWTTLYEQSIAGHTVSGNAYTEAMSVQVPIAKLQIGKSYTATQFSGGGTAWWPGEEQLDGMLRSVYGTLDITRVDATHVTLSNVVQWTASDTNPGNSYGDSVSGTGMANIQSITAY